MIITPIVAIKLTDNSFDVSAIETLDQTFWDTNGGSFNCPNRLLYDAGLTSIAAFPNYNQDGYYFTSFSAANNSLTYENNISGALLGNIFRPFISNPDIIPNDFAMIFVPSSFIEEYRYFDSDGNVTDINTGIVVVGGTSLQTSSPTFFDGQNYVTFLVYDFNAGAGAVLQAIKFQPDGTYLGLFDILGGIPADDINAINVAYLGFNCLMTQIDGDNYLHNQAGIITQIVWTPSGGGFNSNVFSVTLDDPNLEIQFMQLIGGGVDKSAYTGFDNVTGERVIILLYNDGLAYDVIRLPNYSGALSGFMIDDNGNYRIVYAPDFATFTFGETTPILPPTNQFIPNPQPISLPCYNGLFHCVPLIQRKF